MKPALLPADLKSEIQQFTKEKKENIEEEEIAKIRGKHGVK